MIYLFTIGYHQIMQGTKVVCVTFARGGQNFDFISNYKRKLHIENCIV